MQAAVKIEGLKGLKEALEKLPRATSRNVQRRVLLRRAQPIVDAAKSLAPVRTAKLQQSIIATTKRPRGQKTAAAQAFGEVIGRGGSKAAARAAAKEAGSSLVAVFIGPGRLAQAGQQEFGNKNHPPHPYLRPAWDQHQRSVLDGIADDMWAEINKAAARLAKKAARAK